MLYINSFQSDARGAVRLAFNKQSGSHELSSKKIGVHERLYHPTHYGRIVNGCFHFQGYEAPRVICQIKT